MAPPLNENATSSFISVRPTLSAADAARPPLQRAPTQEREKWGGPERKLLMYPKVHLNMIHLDS